MGERSHGATSVGEAGGEGTSSTEVIPSEVQMRGDILKTHVKREWGVVKVNP